MSSRLRTISNHHLKRRAAIRKRALQADQRIVRRGAEGMSDKAHDKAAESLERFEVSTDDRLEVAATRRGPYRWRVTAS